MTGILNQTLSQRLQHYGLSAKKSLGQNFLTDTNLVRKAVALAGNVAQTHLVEIGPGPASLTLELLQTNAPSITAVELDARCLPLLEDIRAASNDRLTIMEGDALTLSLEEICPAPRAIIANLPYNVATPLLLGWLNAIAENPAALESMMLMFQKEVAQRLTAQPGSKAYGRLSVITQWLCEVEYGFDVPPTAFIPPPKITSAIVKLTPRPAPLFAAEQAKLERVVATAFNQRRKMLRSSLKPLFADQAEARLTAAGIDPTRRAETLSIEEFCALANSL